MKQITVLLADNHSVVREGLHALLQAESDIHVSWAGLTQYAIAAGLTENPE